MATAKAKLNLPLPVKIGIGVVVVAALVGAGYFVYKQLKKIGENKDERQEANAAEQELQSLSNQGVKPTFTEAEAKSKATALTVAATDCDFWGQGATQIMAVIYSVKNKADWYLLSTTFGVRSWSDCGTGDISGSLTTLLIEELDSGQMTEVRRHLGQFGISI